MRIDISKYFKMKVSPVLYRRKIETRASKIEDRMGSFTESPNQVSALESHCVEKTKLDNFDKKYTPRRLLLVLACSILACGLLIKYRFCGFRVCIRETCL